MAPTSLLQAVEAYFDAFNAHDAAAVKACFAEAGELRDWDIHKQGADAVQEAVAGIFSAVPEIKCNILQVHEDPAARSAVAELKIDLGGGSSILVADVFSFSEDYKITSLRAYKG